MTAEQVKHILTEHHDRISVCVALSYVNLSKREYETLRYRYMYDRLTQSQLAEKWEVSENTIINWQNSALKKTALMWGKLFIGKILLETIDK